MVSLQISRLKFLAFCIVGMGAFLLSLKSASALPLYARQTGQNCVSCHAGGNYPELTPYGRYFKLTGYTQGERTWVPVSVMFTAGAATTKNNSQGAGDGTNINQQNGRLEPSAASVFVGGKILDNLGLFSQYTYSWAASSNNGGVDNQGHFGADLFDLRYADHYASKDHDLIWGASLNNSPGVTDVWNSSPVWGYPYTIPQPSRGAFGSGVPVKTFLDKASPSYTGYGAYAYLNKNFYAEVDAYQSSTGATSFLTYGSNNSNPNFPKAYLKGTNPYVRLAYTTEWGPHNVMVGAMGMNAASYSNSITAAWDPTAPNWGPPNLSGGTTNYQDRGVDAQYQYLLNPHTLTAQVRYIKENIIDNTGSNSNVTNKLNSVFAKVSYVYNSTYGAGLGYQNVTGTSDVNLYNPSSGTLSNWLTSASSSPNSTAWIPSIWYQPIQYLRLGLQYTAFTKYMGSGSCYNNTSTNTCRNASDNNTTWLYAWIAY